MKHSFRSSVSTTALLLLSMMFVVPTVVRGQDYSGCDDLELTIDWVSQLDGRPCHDINPYQYNWACTSNGNGIPVTLTFTVRNNDPSHGYFLHPVWSEVNDGRDNLLWGIYELQPEETIVATEEISDFCKDFLYSYDVALKTAAAMPGDPSKTVCIKVEEKIINIKGSPP